MFQVIYIPRVHDEVVVAKFDSESDANEYLEQVKEQRPKAYPHFYIKKEEDQ